MRGFTGGARRLVAGAAGLLVLGGLAAGCGSASASGSANTLRLGYLPNITNATALVGVQDGIFAKALGPGVTLHTAVFNAGPAAVQALFSGALDASYLGPSPALDAWVQSHGNAIQIVSGAASGGAALVVRKSITSIAELKGKKIATPQLGNTQDVALRYWLAQHGLHTDIHGGGDVTIVPQSNSLTVQEFRTGQIDGAWVPEPYEAELVKQGGGHVLVDERSLWPGGQFATTVLVVNTSFLHAHPSLVLDLLKGQVAANDFLNKHRAQAEADANKAVKALTGKSLKQSVLKAAFSDITFTDDPIASSILTDAQHAQSLGLLGQASFTGLFDLDPLNQALQAAGEPTVSAP